MVKKKHAFALASAKILSAQSLFDKRFLQEQTTNPIPCQIFLFQHP